MTDKKNKIEVADDNAVLLTHKKELEQCETDLAIAKKSKIPYQLEVEGSGGSDAKELQMSENPWDWCFIGAPEDNVHSPNEKVFKSDIKAMVELYKVLMDKL